MGAKCYLWDQSGQSNPNQACIYAYTVAGVSFAAALALSILQCFTCNLCGLGDWADALFEGAAAAWWGEEKREGAFLLFFRLRVFSFSISSSSSFPLLTFRKLSLSKISQILQTSTQASLLVRERVSIRREKRKDFSFFLREPRLKGKEEEEEENSLSKPLSKKHIQGVFSKYRASADATAVPEAQWREAVVWASVGTCAAFAACGVLSLCKGVMRCCGGER